MLGDARAKDGLVYIPVEGDEDEIGLDEGPGLASGLERGGIELLGFGFSVPGVDGAVEGLRESG